MSKKNDQGKERALHILQSAVRVLNTRGLHALSFESVAQEADLSRQLVRYYYEDIEALMVAVADHLGDAYRAILVSGIVEMGQVERLNFFLDFFFDLADGHEMPDNLAAYDALLAYAVGSEPFRERMCLQYKTLGQVVAHELAIAYPELTGHACEELSYLFVSMMHSHWSFCATLRHSRDHNRLTRRAIDRLIASYRAELPLTPALERPWGRED